MTGSASWSGLRAVLQPLLRVAMLGAFGLGLVVYPYLYLMQERLLFIGAPSDARTLAWARANWPQAERWIAVAEGVTLHGWFRPAPPAAGGAPAPLLIYFGGNAEEVTGLLTACGPGPAARRGELPPGGTGRPADRYAIDHLPGWGLLLVNYRGYGLSGGQPSEAALRADALVLYDWARRQPGVDGTRIVAWGRSLGAGMAVHLAAQRPVAGVVLVSPYDSMAAVAQGHYPLVPVRWLLRHPFEVMAQAAAARAPLLALAMAQDRVIPVAHSRRLVQGWGGPRRLIELVDGDHNRPPQPAYGEAIAEFLSTRVRGPSTR